VHTRMVPRASQSVDALTRRWRRRYRGSYQGRKVAFGNSCLASTSMRSAGANVTSTEAASGRGSQIRDIRAGRQVISNVARENCVRAVCARCMVVAAARALVIAIGVWYLFVGTTDPIRPKSHRPFSGPSAATVGSSCRKWCPSGCQHPSGPKGSLICH
jgi:hypothetical protein